MMPCPPTILLYGDFNAAMRQAVHNLWPVWLWTLRRMWRKYHRQALIWIKMYHIAFRYYKMNYSPTYILPEGAFVPCA